MSAGKNFFLENAVFIPKMLRKLRFLTKKCWILIKKWKILVIFSENLVIFGEKSNGVLLGFFEKIFKFFGQKHKGGSLGKNFHFSDFGGGPVPWFIAHQVDFTRLMRYESLNLFYKKIQYNFIDICVKSNYKAKQAAWNMFKNFITHMNVIKHM